MARKKVRRKLCTLPSLSKISRADHKGERLLEIMRAVAVKNQNEEAQSFYSVRDVAARFGVAISTVSDVYRHLESEGLLNRVRGSQTILQGLQFDRHLHVKGLVGLPAFLTAFLTFQDYRMFFIRIRRELRLRGFATAMIFFDHEEELQTPAFAERLLNYELDTLIWFRPPRSARHTALRLSDTGIRFLAISTEDTSSLGPRYRVRSNNAIHELLGCWKSDFAVDHITLICSTDSECGSETRALEILLKRLRMDFAEIVFAGNRPETFLRKLDGTSGGIVFVGARLPSMLCCRAPEAMTRLLQSHYVALTCGPVNMPFARLPKVEVDVISIDWERIAEVIAADLITQAAFRQQEETIFEAECRMRVLLSEIAQEIYY